jgi:hypothetical protein
MVKLAPESLIHGVDAVGGLARPMKEDVGMLLLLASST